ncbi:MAG: RimK family protein [Planctomycetota bacterium]
MTILLVVERPDNWPLQIPGTEVVRARDYLTKQRFVELERAKVFNLCRSYGYQSVGYYVSLLAVARGHRVMPSVQTLQDLRQASLVRLVSSDLSDRLQKLLGPLEGDRFRLSIYFGHNLAKRYDAICQTLFNHFPAPLLRAEFVRNGEWRLHSLRPVASSEIPDSHRAFVIEQAERFFARPRLVRTRQARFDLAILLDPDEADAPSDAKAIRRFAKAAASLGIRTTTIGKEDYGRIPEFDALFVRATTGVDHYTWRFARRAAAEGLVVIDDPESIVRCTNKVYLAEVFERHDIASPRTIIVHKDNAKGLGGELGFPLVLKQPDSSFSLGVVKVADESELEHKLAEFFARSELVVAQEYAPSEFDWRIGVLDRQALYACKYYMAPGHWQIQKTVGDRQRSYGKVETMPIEAAPRRAVSLAVKAASRIGDGLYGVDLKQFGKRFVVMEVNDNPSIEAGVEDKVLGDELYLQVMRWFLTRLEARGRRGGGA